MLKLNCSRNFIHRDDTAIGVESNVCNDFAFSGIHVQSLLLCRNRIPTIGSPMHVSLILDGGLGICLGLGSDTWCLDFLDGPRRNMKDLPGPSPVEGSDNSAQHMWFQFSQSHSFST